MFRNDVLSPKEIAAMKLAKRKKAIIDKRNFPTLTLSFGFAELAETVQVAVGPEHQELVPYVTN